LKEICNASRIIGYEKVLHIPKFEGRNVTFRKQFDLKELPEKSIFKITAEVLPWNIVQNSTENRPGIFCDRRLYFA
jgi:hypothetical protein